MGIRKKIVLGFVSLATIMFFSGIVSLFELSRLSTNTAQLLESNKTITDVSSQMLDASQDQNSALQNMIVTNQYSYDSLFQIGYGKFQTAIAASKSNVYANNHLDSIIVAHQNYMQVVREIETVPKGEIVHWFLTRYKPSHIALTKAIFNHLAASQKMLGERAQQLESNAYRAITPGIITLAVAIMVLFMFLLMIDTYYVKPTVQIKKSLEGYVNSKIPFDVQVESRDEISRLKELISELIVFNKKR